MEENAFPKSISIAKFQCFGNTIKTINGNCSFRSIKNRHSWCPYCTNRKLNISVAKELAHAKNGRCISETYAHLSYGNAKIIINFASLFQMLKSWCRERMKLGLEFLQMKGVGHVFLVLIITDVLRSLRDVLKDIHGLLGLRGTWCPHCVRESEKLGIEYAKELARSRNGECLSNVYINYTTHLRWRCSKSHEWLASISHRRMCHQNKK